MEPFAKPSSLLIYPNPTQGTITVNTGSSDPVDIEIVDIHGRVVYQLSHIIPGNEFELNTAGAGVYFIKVKVKSRHESDKILLQR